MMKLELRIKCPYCGHGQRIIVASPYGKEVVLCYQKEGGCDNYYAAFWKTSLSAETYAIDMGGVSNG